MSLIKILGKTKLQGKTFFEVLSRLFANGLWNDNVVWNDKLIWKD